MQARTQRLIPGALTGQEIQTARIEELKMLLTWKHWIKLSTGSFTYLNWFEHQELVRQCLNQENRAACSEVAGLRGRSELEVYRAVIFAIHYGFVHRKDLARRISPPIDGGGNRQNACVKSMKAARYIWLTFIECFVLENINHLSKEHKPSL